MLIRTNFFIAGFICYIFSCNFRIVLGMLFVCVCSEILLVFMTMTTFVSHEMLCINIREKRVRMLTKLLLPIRSLVSRLDITFLVDLPGI